jgi:hypothetical protein
MQIIRPDMLPLIVGIIILFLIVVGIIGALALFNGIRSIKQKRGESLALGKIILGCIFLGFVLFNWIGYNKLFSENENLLIGEFKCLKNNSILKVNANKTWTMISNADFFCKNGRWEYVISEDWCYWNVESDNMKCRTQTGSPKTILFEEQNLEFIKIK